MGNKQYIVELNLTDEGKTKFAEATAANIGKQIAIVYDDEIISNPSVKDKIDGGQAYIDGMESYEEADNLASTIDVYKRQHLYRCRDEYGGIDYAAALHE